MGGVAICETDRWPDGQMDGGCVLETSHARSFQLSNCPTVRRSHPPRYRLVSGTTDFADFTDPQIGGREVSSTVGYRSVLPAPCNLRNLWFARSASPLI